MRYADTSSWHRQPNTAMNKLVVVAVDVLIAAAVVVSMLNSSNKRKVVMLITIKWSEVTHVSCVHEQQLSQQQLNRL